MEEQGERDPKAWENPAARLPLQGKVGESPREAFPVFLRKGMGSQEQVSGC